MPLYEYYCEANGASIEVRHPMRFTLKTWGELCYAAQIPLGDTDPLEPVRRRISAVNITVPVSNSKLKDIGFTKLVKRDHGVYENVTAVDGESRYMKAGDLSTVPDFKKKIGD